MIDARWQRCVQNAPRRWRNAFAPRMVRCIAAWLLFKADGLALRGNCFCKRYAGFEWKLKMLLDGVKGQTCSHTADFFCASAELAI